MSVYLSGEGAAPHSVQGPGTLPQTCSDLFNLDLTVQGPLDMLNLDQHVACTVSKWVVWYLTSCYLILVFCIRTILDERIALPSSQMLTVTLPLASPNVVFVQQCSRLISVLFHDNFLYGFKSFSVVLMLQSQKLPTRKFSGLLRAVQIWSIHIFKSC